MNDQKMMSMFATTGAMGVLAKAGFTPRKLIDSGWTRAKLEDDCWSSDDIWDSSLSVRSSVTAGWTKEEMIEFGILPSFHASDLLDSYPEQKMVKLSWQEIMEHDVLAPCRLVAAGWKASIKDTKETCLRELVRSCGWSAKTLVQAEWSLKDLLEDKEWEKIPFVTCPYSQIFDDILTGRRKHDQNTFGPARYGGVGECGTPMCTAGHLISLAGNAGIDLCTKFGVEIAAVVIHSKWRPDVPAPNFGPIPIAYALAYIQERAKEEDQTSENWLFDHRKEI
jgi:hypothetical protein